MYKSKSLFVNNISKICLVNSLDGLIVEEFTSNEKYNSSFSYLFQLYLVFSLQQNKMNYIFVLFCRIDTMLPSGR